MLSKLTANYEAKKNAIKELPFDKLNETSRDKIEAVVGKKCIFRQLPTTIVSCDPQLHLFLVRYPEVVVNIWELMGITTVKLERTGPYTFEAADGMGTTSKIELVYGSRKKHVLYVEAVYDGPLWPKPIRANCVLLLTSKYRRSKSGQIEITDQMDAFVHVENVAVGVIAKTLAPVFGKAADHNFSQSVGFLGRISATAQSNAQGMQVLAGRLTKVEPAVRQRFVDITDASTSLAGVQPGAVTRKSAAAKVPRIAVRSASGESKTDLRTLLRR